MTQPAPETVNPANDAPAAPAPETPAKDTVKLRVVSPWCTGITFPEATGGSLTVTQKGTDVPAADKDGLTEQAKAHGVTLAEVSEK